jgi:hypothetical protein
LRAHPPKHTRANLPQRIESFPWCPTGNEKNRIGYLGRKDRRGNKRTPGEYSRHVTYRIGRKKLDSLLGTKKPNPTFLSPGPFTAIRIVGSRRRSIDAILPRHRASGHLDTEQTTMKTTGGGTDRDKPNLSLLDGTMLHSEETGRQPPIQPRAATYPPH